MSDSDNQDASELPVIKTDNLEGLSGFDKAVAALARAIEDGFFDERPDMEAFWFALDLTDPPYIDSESLKTRLNEILWKHMIEWQLETVVASENRARFLCLANMITLQNLVRI